MENGSFSIKYSSLRLDFDISEGRIALLYIGLDKVKRENADESLNKFHNLVECDYIGGVQNKHRGLKCFDSSYGRSYKYDSHKEEENEKGKHLIIKTKNDDLEIDTHYFIYKDIKAITSYNVVRNIFKKVISLEYISSFAHLGISKSNLDSMYLYEASNSWHVEAQWHKHSFYDLGIINGNENTTMGRYSINNTGSWSTKEHLPMVIIEDTKKKTATLMQIENNGSWHIEVGDFINEVYLIGSGPEYNDNHWLKNLKKGEEFESCHATLSFGEDFEEAIQEITKARRKMIRPSLDHKEMPVIFNDYMHALWDTQTTELILPLVDVASKVGCDLFCMDAGWFAKGSDWWSILGVWEEYAPNFPNGGFIKVMDYIRSKGMKTGLWFEIEAVGVNSPILKKMKDGWLFKVHGVNNVNNDRYQLNFANPEVYKYAMKVIDNAMKLYNLDYIKVDYNVDAGVGNEWKSDSLGDGLLKHNRAYIKWLNEVMDKYPNLTIENCGSGGCRMDYEILKYCPIQSTSDQTNYRKYPYLSTNVFTACVPEQAAVWSYPLNDYEKIMPTDEVVIMNMCNAILGRIHLASFINKLPNKQLNLIKEGIKYYRTLSDFKKRSVPFYPNDIPHFFDKDVCGGILDDSKATLGVWNTSGKPRKVSVNLKKYGVKDIKVGYPLKEETIYSFDKKKQVLTVEFKEDYGGRIFEFTRK